MDTRSRQVWFSRLGASSIETLRRLAVWGNLATAAIVAAAPYISPRPVSERPLYEATAATIGCFGLLLLLGRRWPPLLVRGLAVLLPTCALLVLVSSSELAGVLPMLLVWSVQMTAYFGTRASTLALALLIAVGLGIGVAVSPDQRLSPLAWAVVVLVCGMCGAAVRVIAERGDLLMRILDNRASQDAVTGLLNRRGFDDRLALLWQADQDGDLSVVFFDLDHFKLVNDTYGHANGDLVLRAFAAVLQRSVRQGDVVARTGGEEFGVVLPDRAGRTALARAEVIVEAFGATRVAYSDGVLRCTVSAGVAARSDGYRSAAELCRAADRALYSAKDAGRNCAVLAGG